jgi:hypothetical protein
MNSGKMPDINPIAPGVTKESTDKEKLTTLALTAGTIYLLSH